MKKWVLLIVTLFMPANTIALEKITDAKLKEGFAETVRMHGYLCNSCNNIYFVGENARGFVFRIICSNNVLAFTLIVTPTGNFIVELW
jgi:hypothetical protein